MEIYTDKSLVPGRFYIECFLDRKTFSKQETLIENEISLKDFVPGLGIGRKFLPLISEEAASVIEETKDLYRTNEKIYILKISFNNEEKYLDVSDGFYTIGRSERCDFCLISPDHKISRRHIELLLEDDKVFINPIGINGTYLNGEKLELGKNTQILINDEIKIGEYVLELKL